MTRAAVRPTVVFCTNRYRTYDRRMYEVLAEAFDLRVLWVSPPPAGEPVPDELAARIQSATVGSAARKLKPNDLRRTAALTKLASAWSRDADLVVASGANTWKAQVMFAVARRHRVPVALRTDLWSERFHGTAEGARALYWRAQRRLTRFVELRADAMLASGRKIEEYLLASGVAPERIKPFRYLHPDLAALPLDSALVGRLRALKGRRVAFLYVGRIMEQKGLVPLIAAFRRVLADGHDAVLFVVGAAIESDTGRGKVSTSYYDRARELAGDETRIVFEGACPPSVVHNYYAASDVFVHSHVAQVDGHDVFEAWGNVITEAASMGLAIVSSDRVPSAYDMLGEDGATCLVHAETIETDLEHVLARLAGDPAQVRALGQATRRRYEAFSDPRINVSSLEDVIAASRA